MKTAIKYFSGVLLLLLLGIACEKEVTNPFDPDCPKEIWTPKNFQVAQSENKLDLTWEQENMNITGFKIDRKVGTEDWSNVASPGKTATSWSDSDLKGGEVHSYRLCAFAGDNMSNTVAAQATPVFTASLTTAAQTNLTCNSVTLGGNISNTGGATITERGIVYAKSDNPTTSHTKVAMGNGEGSFKQSVTGLEETATYYVRAYAINSAGTSYGNQISFTTPACAQPATVITSTPTNVTSTSATLGGNVTDDGGATVTERGVVYNTSENPTFAHNKVQIGSGKGSFSKSVTGLAENTTYFVCAYAINSQDTAYGNQESFKTSQKILTVTPSSREVGPESGTTSFTVNSNVTWSVKNVSATWLAASKASNTKLNVSFNENTTTNSRSATITVTGGGIDSDVNVIQTSNLLAYYPLTSDTKDYSSNYTNVTIKNCIFAGGGIYSNGKYIYNDSNGSLIQTPNITHFNKNSFEVSVDFKVTEMPTSYERPVFVIGRSYREFGFLLNSDKTIGLLLHNHNRYKSSQTYNLTDNKWHSARIEYYNGIASLYLDNNLIIRISFTASFPDDDKIVTNTNFSNATAFKGYWRNLIIKNK